MPATATEQNRANVNTEFADLVVAMLAARSWSQAFTPKRTWLPTYELEDLLDQLVVHVVPTTLAMSVADRAAVHHHPTCEIGLMLKPDWEPAAESDPAVDRNAFLDAACDARCGLVEEICDYFARPGGREHTQAPTRGLKFNIALPEVPTLVLREHLEGAGQITSVIRLTGKVRR